MRNWLLGVVALTAAAGTAQAEAPRVATDIAPVQSIAARVMAGIGTPDLVIPPGASPHGYALRPSEARALQDADLVVWIGSALTPWLADPIDTLAPDAPRLTLEDAPGITLLPARSGDGFEAHDHDHADEGGDHDAEHAHAEAAGDHDHDAGPEQDHGPEDDHHAEAAGHDEADAAHSIDGHLWLSPGNAAAAAQAIAGALADIDPEHAAAYAANAAAFATELDALSAEIETALAPVRGRPYIVFHDAFHYFEDAFDIPATGSVVLQEGVEPSAARVAALRDRIATSGIDCAFTEPQFEPRLLHTLVEGTDARIGEIDDIGAALPPGPDLYPSLLRGIATGLRDCLSAG